VYIEREKKYIQREEDGRIGKRKKEIMNEKRKN